MLMLRRPDAIEQSFAEMIEEAMADHEVVLVDDFHLITAITGHYNYTRAGLMDAVLEGVVATICAQSRKLILATNKEDAPWSIRSRAWCFDVGDFTPADYEAIASAFPVGPLTSWTTRRFTASPPGSTRTRSRTPACGPATAALAPLRRSLSI